METMFPVVIPLHEKLLPKIDRCGTFSHPWPVSFPSVWSFLKWMSNRQPPLIPPDEEVQRTLPYSSDLKDILHSFNADNFALWLGHSSVILRMAGCTMLFDPVFSDRVPKKFGPRRFRDSLVRCVEHLPYIDMVMISHNHYDHLDAPSIKSLAEWFPRVKWFCGKKVGPTIRQIAHSYQPDPEIHEMTWFDDFLTEDESLQIMFLPAQHWSTRNGLDTRRSLWGSWAVLSKNSRFYFAGDTGYNPTLFKKIGSLLGPFDLCALPIGAYKPRNIMAAQHISPAEAVEIHKDLLSKKSFAMHWGTFPLADEDYLDPPKDLEAAMEDNKISSDKFLVLQHGQCIHF